MDTINLNGIGMNEFDKLVLRAAHFKRKDIVDRYGDEGCEKLLARGASRKTTTSEDQEYAKRNFRRTIRELLEGLEESPWYEKPTKPQDIENAWRWDLSDSKTGTMRCNVQTRRVKNIESAWRWDLSDRTNDDQFNVLSRRHSMDL